MLYMHAMLFKMATDQLTPVQEQCVVKFLVTEGSKLAEIQRPLAFVMENRLQLNRSWRTKGSHRRVVMSRRTVNFRNRERNSTLPEYIISLPDWKKWLMELWAGKEVGVAMTKDYVKK